MYVCPFQLNPDVSAFQRKFTNDVRRCDEMERKLRFLLNELEKAGIEPRPSGSVEAPDPQGEKTENFYSIAQWICITLGDEIKPSLPISDSTFFCLDDAIHSFVRSIICSCDG